MASPDDLGTLTSALRAGRFEVVRDAIRALPAARRSDPRLQQILGLAHRGLLDSADAHAAFARAAAALPTDPLIAHSLARTALEAGWPAMALFDAAQRLAPRDAGVWLGRAAAQVAEGQASAACDDLARRLREHPDWTEGHRTYARIRAQFEPGDSPATTLRAALSANPRAAPLWHALIGVHLGAYDYVRAVEDVTRAREALGSSVALDLLEAQCLSELGRAEEAHRLFDGQPVPATAAEAIAPLRNFIRLGRHVEALQLAMRDYPAEGLADIWPYRALLWRLLGDSRGDWLEGDERFVRSYDLGAEIGPLDALADCLRAIHRAAHQPLDQSVRGGTQTDGNLFARAEPEIRRLRDAIDEAVRDYVAQLPPPDPAHPTLPAIRAPLPFEGAWSVRLSGAGYHHDHVHTHGWISSACYIALPDTRGDAPEAGCLTFGENRRLLPDLAAFRTVEPKPGRLVLFPSTMWHGTRPFAAGERLTVTFDIARPGQ